MAEASTSSAERKERFDLHALYETSRLLSSSLDLDFVLNTLLLTAMSKLLVTKGVVCLHEPVESAYRVAAVKGVGGLQKDSLLKVSSGNGQAPDLSEYNLTLRRTISSGQRDIGFLALGPKGTGQPFSDDELTFVGSLVHMSSVAVHNALMIGELRQANRDLDAKVQELNTLFDLSQEFNAVLEEDQVIKLLSFALMGQLLIRKYVFLLRPNEGETEESPLKVTTEGGAGADGRTLQIVASRGVDESVLTQEECERLGTLTQMAMLDEEGNDTCDALRAEGISLLLPIRHQNETRGVLALGPKMTGEGYSHGDVEFLQALGNLAYVSIQNTYLIEEQIEKERLAKEIRLARQIQERLLPRSLPEVAGLDLAAMTRSSREVGGDYYDVEMLEGGRALMAIADVTGKGLPAAMLMANLQASLQTLLPMDMSLAEATAHINRVISGNTDLDKFITFFHAIFEPDGGRLRFVNAGHNPPFLVRSDGSMQELEAGGLLLGVMANASYEEGVVDLEEGDLVVFFTDGITEAMSPEQEEYGEARLQKVLEEYHTSAAGDILDAVLADVRRFTEDPPERSDDRTLIVAKAG